ncbi:aldehyde dehydrogenase family protein [Cyclobacterium salsum]|uniref:aldehyde dehydrogenase family protein n=1 Tax=Cyclobacterium salsum TaxID=2666329 RepID=UPI001F3FBAAE|nr:aldehyde dehydrogenase family protein [Cyclobacterium salsum]
MVMGNEIHEVSDTWMEESFVLQRKAGLRNRAAPLQDRIDRLEALKDWIKSNQKWIKEALYQDLKKSGTEAAITEIYVVLSEIQHALRNLPKWAKPEKVKTPFSLLGSKSYVQVEPKGTALILSPWNYPFNLSVGPMVSAIAAGCTVMLKPSEMAPHTAALLEKMVAALYGREQVTVLNGGVYLAQKLLQKPFDHVFFTGSPKVGKKVMEAAAQHLSSVTLELGGKSPVIVDKGVDLEKAAERIVWGKLINCGQTCLAPDYLLVHETDKEDLISLLKQKINELYNPRDKGIIANPDYGRLINIGHLNRLQSLLTEALVGGATIIVGGTVNEEERYMEPTLLEGVTTGMKLMEEEIFGPILPLFTYRNIDEAIAMVSAQPKPLALYLFSEEPHLTDHVSTHTSSGTVVVNDCAVQFGHPGLPFGGVGQSGVGKAHGKYGFLAFSNEKAVLKQRSGRTALRVLYPPYGLKEKKITQFLMRWL